jgi:hypothetical protein
MLTWGAMILALKLASTTGLPIALKIAAGFKAIAILEASLAAALAGAILDLSLARRLLAEIRALTRIPETDDLALIGVVREARRLVGCR